MWSSAASVLTGFSSMTQLLDTRTMNISALCSRSAESLWVMEKLPDRFQSRPVCPFVCLCAARRITEQRTRFEDIDLQTHAAQLSTRDVVRSLHTLTLPHSTVHYTLCVCVHRSLELINEMTERNDWMSLAGGLAADVLCTLKYSSGINRWTVQVCTK